VTQKLTGNILGAEQAGQTVRMMVYAVIITDMIGSGTREKCQQCFQVNIVTIIAVLTIDIEDSIQYLCIKNTA
jgi:hypothetical protein